ncbi:MAG: MarR family transcriptional regulator [Dehalococcoidia bacterium]|nr:MarR family transcriptional regulator [Dehalococcoidia bacterium]
MSSLKQPVDAGEAPESSSDPQQLAVARYSAAFPSADSTALAAHLQVIRAGVEMSQAVARSLGSLDNPVTGPRYSLLRVLYFADGQRLPQNELARQLGSTPANVTQLIDGLERDGYVERVTNAADRRVTYAQLTGHGRTTCDVLVPHMVQVMEATVSGLDRQEMTDLARLLAKLRRHLATYQPRVEA